MNFENYKSVFEKTGLFKGIKSFDLMSLLDCLNAVTHNVRKGQIVLLAGDKPEFIGVVLSGKIHIIREDCGGKRSLVAAVQSGGIFAETMCCADVSQSPVTIIAAENSGYLKLRFTYLLKTCSKFCVFHKRLMENMLSLLAKKNLMLQRRMEILELKTIREKVMRYFESFAESRITLPFNREEMADFLCVDRSALSHELIKMRNDGLIDYKKNIFTVF